MHSIVNDRSNECLRSALWINRTSLVKKRRLSRQTAIMIASFRRRELRSLNLFAFLTQPLIVSDSLAEDMKCFLILLACTNAGGR